MPVVVVDKPIKVVDKPVKVVSRATTMLVLGNPVVGNKVVMTFFI